MSLKIFTAPSASRKTNLSVKRVLETRKKHLPDYRSGDSVKLIIRIGNGQRMDDELA